jgi:hypothetical protein
LKLIQVKNGLDIDPETENKTSEIADFIIFEFIEKLFSVFKTEDFGKSFESSHLILVFQDLDFNKISSSFV